MFDAFQNLLTVFALIFALLTAARPLLADHLGGARPHSAVDEELRRKATPQLSGHRASALHPLAEP